MADSIRHVTGAVAMVEDQLADGREWLMGELTIADFETFAWLVGLPILLPEAFAGKDKALAWMDRVRARPSVQAVLARAGTAAPEQSWAPGPEINRWG